MPSRILKENIEIIYERIKEKAPPHHFEFQDPFWVLITTILSHRTKDEVTDPAARRLFERYKDPNGLSSAKQEDVERLINKVGFYKVKAERVIQAARIIKEHYGGNVPVNADDLMKIPGVGRKTANVVLADSMGIPAIAVDTHVFRISRRIGLSSGKRPDEVESDLMRIIPKKLWLGFNPVMVEFGKKICRPINPKCDICNITKFCNFYRKNHNKTLKQDSNKH
jgi:endonuclease-3